jgi:glutaminase
LKTCEALSTHFGLHMLNRTGDVRTSIIADYDIGGITSRRSRKLRDQQILEEHHEEVRVIELVGALTFAIVDYLSRRLAARPVQVVIIDFRRVASITHAAGLLLTEILRNSSGETATVLAGIEPTSAFWSTLNPLIIDSGKVRTLPLLDEAIEWAEDQIIFRYGGYTAATTAVPLKEQALLAGLTDGELADLTKLGAPRSYPAGKRIVAAGAPATSLFFLQSGKVSVKLPSGVRLASLDAGMEFGEMTLLDEPRSAMYGPTPTWRAWNCRSRNSIASAKSIRGSPSASRAISRRSLPSGLFSPTQRSICSARPNAKWVVCMSPLGQKRT